MRLMVSLVTPLDVVRVRLQSQPSNTSSVAPSTLRPSNFANLPPNLGVSACCREVFWVNNTSNFCIASPSPSLTLDPSVSSPELKDCAVDTARRKNFTSTLDGLRKIARNEGLPSLWRGLSPTLVMSVPANVIYFTGYDTLRTHPASPIRRYIPENYAPLIAGSIARVTAAVVVSPIEMFRTRIQATSGTGVFRETLGRLRRMVETQGITSLWRGLTLTMWRDVPFSGFYWWGYEATRNTITNVRDRQRELTVDSAPNIPRPRAHSRSKENHTATFIDSFIAGATSGAVAALITTPFDVGKTRQQVFEHSPRNQSHNTSIQGKDTVRPEERSMPRFLYHIWREEGMAGLFRGWAARCLKVAPACAIMISSYEVGKKMARNGNERRRDQT